MTALGDPRGVWVKVDGVTRPDDAAVAADAGVSAVGMIFAPSPRRVTLTHAERVRAAIPAHVLAFGVFDGSSAQEVVRAVDVLSLDGVQFPAPAGIARDERLVVLRTVRVRGAGDLDGLDALDCDAVHLDAYVEGSLGGTGRLAPWDVIETHRPRVPFVLSGGLRPDNVAEAVRRIRPHGVDVSSGVESSPRVKDPGLLEAFVRSAREAL